MKTLKSTLSDWPKVGALMKKHFGNQLWKIHIQHTQDRNKNIKVFFNIGLFCYFPYKIDEYAFKFILLHKLDVNANIVLLFYIHLFTKTLVLPYKYKI